MRHLFQAFLCGAILCCTAELGAQCLPTNNFVCSGSPNFVSRGWLPASKVWKSVTVTQTGYHWFFIYDSVLGTSNTNDVIYELKTCGKGKIQLHCQQYGGYINSTATKQNADNNDCGGSANNEHMFFTGRHCFPHILGDSCNGTTDTFTLYYRVFCNPSLNKDNYGTGEWLGNVCNFSTTSHMAQYVGRYATESRNFSRSFASGQPDSVSGYCPMCPIGTRDTSYYTVQYRMRWWQGMGLYKIVSNSPNRMLLRSHGHIREIFNYTSGTIPASKFVISYIDSIATSAGNWEYEVLKDVAPFAGDMYMCKMNAFTGFGNGKWNALVHDRITWPPTDAKIIDNGSNNYYQGSFATSGEKFGYSWTGTQPTMAGERCGQTMNNDSFKVQMLMKVNVPQGNYRFRVRCSSWVDLYFTNSGNTYYSGILTNSGIGTYDQTSAWYALNGIQFLALNFRHYTGNQYISFNYARQPKNVGTVSVAVSGGTGDTVCAGSSVTLTADTVDGTQQVWYINCTGTGGNISCANGILVGTGNSITVTPDSSTTYYVKNRNLSVAADDTLNKLDLYSAAWATKRITRVSVDTTANSGVLSSNKDTVCPTKKLMLNVSGYTGALQWQSKDTSNVWEVITGATNDTLHVDSFMVTTSFRVVATTGICGKDTSAVKTIYLNTSFDCIYENNWYYLLVHTTDTNNIPIHSDSLKSRNATLNAVLDEMQVTQFYKPFGGAQTAYLNDVYAIHCNGDVDTLYKRILDGEFFEKIIPAPYFMANCSSECPSNVGYITPNDPIYPTGYSSNWALEMIQAGCAWTITTGNADIVVGVVDGEFDIAHEDLVDKFEGVFGSNPATSNIKIHGTRVASCLAGETNNGIGMSSVGYNTQMAGYLVYNEIVPLFGGVIDPFPGFWNAYQDRRPIICASVAPIGCPGGVIGCLFEEYIELANTIIGEIINSGTSIVVAAGNDATKTFHDIYDYSSIPGVIIVGGVDENNFHGPTNFSHYPTVDLCGPSKGILVANPSYAPNDSYCMAGEKYCEIDGTSFAAPMVAGTAALMLAVNPCLGPVDIEHILKSTTDAICDAGSFSGIIGTGRLNAYQACLMAQNYNNYINVPQEIKTNTIWSQKNKIHGDVIIRSGATLTITNGAVIEVSDNRSIIIEPGAKLIVDDATITNSCAGMWNGIIIQGDKTYPQTMSTNNNNTAMSDQGFVYLYNATIENAYEALRVWNYEDGWVSTNTGDNQGGTGGIVRAVNTTFRNNRRSAEFMWYKSLMGVPGGGVVEVPNKSYFKNCTFTTDDEHPDQHPFSAHVTAWGVKDIRFEGCKFENARTIDAGLNATVLGTGIGAIDAGIIVDDYIYGSSQNGTAFVQSEFKNLHHGVWVANGTSPYTTSVKHAKFENCIRGIRNEGVNMATFVGNEFTQGGNAAIDYSSPLDEGILLHQATGFVVEQNKFTTAATPAQGHLTIGIRADGTGTSDNKIYKNELLNVHVGNLANRQNQTVDANGFAYGLRYECNAHSGNDAYDICVNSNTPGAGYGVKTRQEGSNGEGSGNSFTNGTPLIPERDFYNSGVGIDYYHDGVLLPVAKSASVNTTVPTRDPNDCVVNYTFPTTGNPNGGGCSTCLTFSGYSSAYTTHKAAQANYKSQYIALVDGGNTAARKTMVDTVSNASRLKDSLTLYAPNLSSIVLDKVARKGLLNDTVKYEVMKANAEGVNYEVYDYLENRLNLPQWMLDSISAARNNLTLRSYLLDTLTYHTEQRAQANYAVLRLIQEDTAGLNIDTYRQWLDSADGVWAKREMVNTYLHEAKYDTIATLLAHYDTLIEKADSASFKNYKDYTTAYAGWMQSDSSIVRLDSAHKAALQSIAEIDEHKKGSNAARNVLNFFYDSSYFTSGVLPDEQFNKKGNDDEPNTWQAPQQQTIKELPSMKLYPNPAKDAVTIEYSAIAEGSKLYVSDAMGVLHEMRLLNGEKGKIVLNTANYTNGIYMARVETEDGSPLKSKFVILK